MGMSLADLGLTQEREIRHWAVKEAVFPFDRFDNVDTPAGTGDEVHRRGHGD